MTYLFNVPALAGVAESGCFPSSETSTTGLSDFRFDGNISLMTCIRSISRFVVVFIALAGITAAAIPAGWIALKHVPAQGEESGYWILVKEPEDGLSAWWSDEELAKIIAGDEEYVQHLETDWSPDDHEVADSTEAAELAEELAEYWGGDLPQANYWAHGALTRRGDTPQAFHWEQEGLAQRD